MKINVNKSEIMRIRKGKGIMLNINIDGKNWNKSECSVT